MLRVSDVHVYYGDSHVVQGASLEVGERTCVAVVGRNGAGKTTLMRAIMGLTRARRGSIEHRGRPITHLPPEEVVRRGLALVPQGRRVFRSLTVEEHLRLAYLPRGPWTVSRVYDLFPQLARRRRHRGGQLSGGEQQMLAIARALVTNPDTLLMDEPSEGLSPLLVREIGRIIRELKASGLSVLLVEQSLPLAFSVADRVYVMSTGAVVWEGTPQALDADDAVKSRFLGV